MSRPTTRAQLLDAMDAEYARLRQSVARLPAELRDRPGACDAWSVKDLLAHLHAWQVMLLAWEAEGAAGGSPVIPAPGYTWTTTPALNEEIRMRTRDDPWEAVCARLDESHARVRSLIAGWEGDLFAKGVVRWTGSTSVGAYAVSATSSHDAWATTLIRRFAAAAA